MRNVSPNGGHGESRGCFESVEIARQYLEETKPDVVLGGGEDRWLPPGEPGAWPDHPWTDPTEESSGTAGNLVARAQELGYEYASNGAELAAGACREPE